MLAANEAQHVARFADGRDLARASVSRLAIAFGFRRVV